MKVRVLAVISLCESLSIRSVLTFVVAKQWRWVDAGSTKGWNLVCKSRHYVAVTHTKFNISFKMLNPFLFTSPIEHSFPFSLTALPSRSHFLFPSLSLLFIPSLFLPPSRINRNNLFNNQQPPVYYQRYDFGTCIFILMND